MVGEGTSGSRRVLQKERTRREAKAGQGGKRGCFHTAGVRTGIA